MKIKLGLIINLGLIMATTLNAQELPYRAQNEHLGVASCASSVCHGAVTKNKHFFVPMNEYMLWSRYDRHSKAYETLLSVESQHIAHKLGLKNAHQAPLCLDCHSDYIPENLKGPQYHVEDGIGCEACHGGAERWLSTHTAENSNHQDNLAQGMYPTDQTPARAELCLSCHYGNEDKFATHRIMGAGHPRLSFELETFSSLLPPHYELDQDYADRKRIPANGELWTVGQLTLAQSYLQSLRSKRLDGTGMFPELAFFDCHSCHSSMRDLDWNRRSNTLKIAPGTIRINDSYLLMVQLIAKQIDPALAEKLLHAIRNLHSSANQSRRDTRSAAHRIATLLQRLEHIVAQRPLSPDDMEEIFKNLVQTGLKGEYRNYGGAEQAMMALEMILTITNREDHRTTVTRNQLYQLLSNDEAFQAKKFKRSLRALAD